MSSHSCPSAGPSRPAATPASQALAAAASLERLAFQDPPPREAHAAALRARAIFFAAELRLRLACHVPEKPFRLLSLGAPPWLARVLARPAAENAGIPVDACVVGSARAGEDEVLPDGVRIEYRELEALPATQADDGPNDLAIVPGLLDFLPDGEAVALVALLLATVREGGVVALACLDSAIAAAPVERAAGRAPHARGEAELAALALRSPLVRNHPFVVLPRGPNGYLLVQRRRAKKPA